MSLGVLVILSIFLVRNTLLRYENHSICISLMLLVGIPTHHHRFYKHNFRQRFEVKTPRYIGAVLVSYEICRNSIYSQPLLNSLQQPQDLISLWNILDMFSKNSEKQCFLIKLVFRKSVIIKGFSKEV